MYPSPIQLIVLTNRDLRYCYRQHRPERWLFARSTAGQFLSYYTPRPRRICQSAQPPSCPVAVPKGPKLPFSRFSPAARDRDRARRVKWISVPLSAATRIGAIVGHHGLGRRKHDSIRRLPLYRFGTNGTVVVHPTHQPTSCSPYYFK